MSQPLINPADLAVDEDAQVALASERIRSYCGWHIFPSITETLLLDGPGQHFLMLPSMYVTDIVSVTEDGYLVDGSQYEWSASGQVWRSWPWTGHFRAVAVELTHGYDTVPEAVKDVAITLAKRVPAAMAGVVQEQAGTVSRTFGGALTSAELLTAAERLVLAPYKLPPRA